MLCAGEGQGASQVVKRGWGEHILLGGAGSGMYRHSVLSHTPRANGSSRLSPAPSPGTAPAGSARPRLPDRAAGILAGYRAGLERKSRTESGPRLCDRGRHSRPAAGTSPPPRLDDREAARELCGPMDSAL